MRRARAQSGRRQGIFDLYRIDLRFFVTALPAERFPLQSPVMEEKLESSQIPGLKSAAASGNSRRRRLVALVLIGLVVVAFMAIVQAFSGGLPEVTPDDLAQARLRWDQVRPSNYDIRIVLSGRQIGELVVAVRDGQPVSMTRNDVKVEHPRTWRPWTVTGMFQTLETDFENRAEAAKKFGVEPKNVHIRCQFDDEYGYPERYLHQVYGQHQDLEWTVVDFQKK